MAKSTAKKPAAPRKPAKPTKAPSQVIEEASQLAVDKLRALNADPQLQGEIDWCLASYRADGNPVGLYLMVERTINVLRAELAKKTKGITAKFISDLEKAFNTR